MFFSPRVALCGYSIPHPSEAKVNIRVQTTGTYNYNYNPFPENMHLSPSFNHEHYLHSYSTIAGDPAKEVLKDSCQDLMMICQHVRSTFEQAVADFKNNEGSESQ